MIVKTRSVPLSIQKLQALLRRLPKNHQKIPIIQEDLAKKMAGYRGEYSIDYPLSFVPSKDYSILHDIRLPFKEYFFQIDTLILSQRFILILEVKNIAGKLYFDQDFHQLIRTLDGKEEGFPDPILQIRRHEFQMKAWLEKHKFPELPMESLVVISNPYSQIQISPEHKHLHKIILHREALSSKISKIDHLHKKEILTEKLLKKIIRLLMKQHRESNSSILDQFGIKRHELQKGVQCMDCNHLAMQRKHGSWFCPNCYYKCKNAHIEALKDYCYLINSTITNQEARDFLLLSSLDVTTRILRSTATKFDGVYKSTLYHLTFED
ncbi:nuclease-related domain-containing protein [Fictibacillus sp. FJAT-27399]|uniref:nuclease-related domain-containing protein n=1 Tax=Fictibacillus sp. FJAT-27399 TaxID=1729689 RepID=UPI0007809A5D|nr:nuclease-related domain-containing protein [Fictibacillus sp. FJAT-27399]